MYYWLNALVGGVLYVFCLGLFWNYLLMPRWPKLPRWLSCFIYTAVSFVPGVVRSLCADDSILFAVMEYAEMAILLIYLIAAFKSKWWKKLLAFFIMMVVSMVAESIVVPLFESRGIVLSTDFTTYEMFVIQTVECIVSLGLLLIAVFIWNRIEKKRHIPKMVWMFLLIPASQTIVLWNVVEYYMIDSTNVISTIVGGILSFAADIVMFYAIVSQGEKEALTEKLRETEALRRTEELHYNTIQSRREALAKIRHDYNNQIATVLQLIKAGEAGQAETILQKLGSNISETKEQQFSSNSIINAVMLEKSSECEKYGIELDYELMVAEDIKIEAIHICSVMTNLLDNAIKATKNCPADSRKIIVKAGKKGAYLSVRVENPVPESIVKEKRDRKSYGQEILKDIAKQYSGTFTAEEKDKKYSAFIVLEETE